MDTIKYIKFIINNIYNFERPDMNMIKEKMNKYLVTLSNYGKKTVYFPSCTYDKFKDIKNIKYTNDLNKMTVLSEFSILYNKIQKTYQNISYDDKKIVILKQLFLKYLYHPSYDEKTLSLLIQTINKDIKKYNDIINNYYTLNFIFNILIYKFKGLQAFNLFNDDEIPEYFYNKTHISNTLFDTLNNEYIRSNNINDKVDWKVITELSILIYLLLDSLNLKNIDDSNIFLLFIETRFGTMIKNKIKENLEAFINNNLDFIEGLSLFNSKIKPTDNNCNDNNRFIFIYENKINIKFHNKLIFGDNILGNDIWNNENIIKFIDKVELITPKFISKYNINKNIINENMISFVIPESDIGYLGFYKMAKHCIIVDIIKNISKHVILYNNRLYVLFKINDDDIIYGINYFDDKYNIKIIMFDRDKNIEYKLEMGNI